jgi:hypothetical protein
MVRYEQFDTKPNHITKRLLQAIIHKFSMWRDKRKSNIAEQRGTHIAQQHDADYQKAEKSYKQFINNKKNNDPLLNNNNEVLYQQYIQQYGELPKNEKVVQLDEGYLKARQAKIKELFDNIHHKKSKQSTLRGH